MTLMEFLRSLIFDDEARQDFAANPDQALADAGLGDLKAEDVSDALSMMHDDGTDEVDIAAPAPVKHDDDGGSESAAEYITSYVTNNYVHNEGDTIVDNSINQSFEAGGDLNIDQDFDINTNVAIGDGAVAAGGDIEGSTIGDGNTSVSGEGNQVSTGDGQTSFGSGDVSSSNIDGDVNTGDGSSFAMGGDSSVDSSDHSDDDVNIDNSDNSVSDSGNTSTWEDNSQDNDDYSQDNDDYSDNSSHEDNDSESTDSHDSSDNDFSVEA